MNLGITNLSFLAVVAVVLFLYLLLERPQMAMRLLGGIARVLWTVGVFLVRALTAVFGTLSRLLFRRRR